MEIVKKDKAKAMEELAEYEASKKNIDNRLQVLKEFQDSAAGTLVKGIFEEEIASTEETIRTILQNDMKAVFLMKDSDQAEHIKQLSKKELVLSEVLGVLKTIQGRIFKG